MSDEEATALLDDLHIMLDNVIANALKARSGILVERVPALAFNV